MRAALLGVLVLSANVVFGQVAGPGMNQRPSESRRTQCGLLPLMKPGRGHIIIWKEAELKYLKRQEKNRYGW